MTEAPIKQQLEESLSALVDGEASELELRRLLKVSDEEYMDLRDRWFRYQAISTSLKQEIPAIAPCDLSASISAAVAEEATYSAPPNKKPKSSRWSLWSGIGRLAVAASVAGAVVLGVQFSPSGIDNQIVDVDPIPAPSHTIPQHFNDRLSNKATVSTVGNESGSTPSTRSKKQAIGLTEETRRQLKATELQVNRLMLEHAQNASQNTQQGVLPYMRVPESTESN